MSMDIRKMINTNFVVETEAFQENENESENEQNEPFLSPSLKDDHDHDSSCDVSSIEDKESTGGSTSDYQSVNDDSLSNNDNDTGLTDTRTYVRERLMEYSDEQLETILQCIDNLSSLNIKSKKEECTNNISKNDSDEVYALQASLQRYKNDLESMKIAMENEKRERCDIIERVVASSTRNKDEQIMFLRKMVNDKSQEVSNIREEKKQVYNELSKTFEMKQEAMTKLVEKLREENNHLNETYADFMKMASNVSAEKGEGFENTLYKQLTEAMQCYYGNIVQCTLVRASAGTGDLLIENVETGSRIMVEAKHYTNTVSADQVKKFKRDVLDPKNNYCGGIFVATCSIARKKPYETETIAGKKMVYIPHYTLERIEQLKGYVLEFLSNNTDADSERISIDDEKELRVKSYRQDIEIKQSLLNSVSKIEASIEKKSQDFKERFGETIEEYHEQNKAGKEKNSTSYSDVKPILQEMLEIDEKSSINKNKLRDHIIELYPKFNAKGVAQAINAYLKEMSLPIPSGRSTKVVGVKMVL